MKKIQVIILSSVLVAGIATAAVAANWDTISQTGTDTRNTEAKASLSSAAPSTEAVTDANSNADTNVNKASAPVRGQAPKKGGHLANLVTAGTITQTQADTVMKALQSNKNTDVSEALAALVKAGTINQNQSTAISAVLKDKRSGGGPLASLVSAGTITQSQADTIMKAMQPGSGKTMSEVLSSLVSAGTITQSQADKISSMKIVTPPDKGNGGPGQGPGQGPAPQQ